jgi:carboxyl-terminal processing protease
VPVTTSSLAAADSANYQELETFMSVYERVKAQYVDRSTTIRSSRARSTECCLARSAFLLCRSRRLRRLKRRPTAITAVSESPFGVEDGAVKIVSPMEDTPAWRAGLKSGDYITHINSELLYGLSLDEAVEKMKGAPGTNVKLSIVRPGRDKPFDVSLVRERIELVP